MASSKLGAGIQCALLFTIAVLLHQVKGVSFKDCGVFQNTSKNIICQCPDFPGCACPPLPYTGDACPLCLNCSYCGNTTILGYTFYRYCPTQSQCNSDDIISKCVAQYSGKKKCFPSDATVTLPGGTSKRMSDVRVGEMVQVLRDDGSIAYERLYAFSHRAANELMDTIVLTTDSGETVEASPGHYILAGLKQERMPIRDVMVGDTVWVVKNNAFLEATSVVNKVYKQERIGVFAPHTASGTIFIGNVAMSCFTEHVPSKVATALLAPVQLASTLLGDGAFEELNNRILAFFNKYSV